MTREEAIKTLGKELACNKISDDCGLNCGKCNLRTNLKDLMEAYELAIRALKVLPESCIAFGIPLRNENWIPVSDPLNELPKDKHLLVTVEEEVHPGDIRRYVTELHYDMTEWIESMDAENTIAYICYPEPYKAESEDQND